MMQADGPQITLYFYPTPRGLDWGSPAALARTAVLGALRSRSHVIGHATVELSTGAGRVEHTGMTNAEPRKTAKLLLAGGAGFEVLLYGFKGRLESVDEIERYQRLHRRNGRLSFVRFRLSEAGGQLLERYLAEYRARGVGAVYGLPHRPRHAEGAGCSAFAASFLEVAGLLDATMRARWTRSIRIPEGLVGGARTGGRISSLRLFAGREPWAAAEEPHFPVDFWDPDRMHDWVQDVVRRGLYAPSLPFAAVDDGGVLGVIVDARGVAPPAERLWLTPG